MEGEARSRKPDFAREKHGPISLRKRSFQEKKVKSESLTYSASGSIGERSLDGMIVVGKGCSFMKSRSLESGHYFHDYHSETSIRPVTSETKLRENVPNEGLEIGLPAYQTVSSTSFTSAKSDISNADALQKRIQEMENEISGKNAMIARLKKEVGKEGGFDLNSTAVETELTFEIMEDYENKLKKLKKSVSDRDKKITELTLKLEETVKAKSLQAEENKGLTHEVNLLNRQLQSMHELIHSQTWEKNGDPKEVAKYKTRITELEFTLSKQDALLKELHRTIEKHDFSLKSKEKELKAKNQELSEYKSKSNMEIRKLLNQIDSLEKDSSRNKKKEGDAMQKISNLPKDVIDRIIKLCETGEINAVKNYAEQRDTFERKLSTIREEHDNEIKRLTDIHDSKLNFLKKEIEMLNEQLRERNAMLETYGNELSLHRSDPAAKSSEDLDSLKVLFNAEISSQKQIHKLEMDLFEEKVKRLSEDILYRAKNEEIHLQELQNAKASANSFKVKYEQLLEEWEEKTKVKVPEGTFLDKMELDDIVDQFKKLTAELRKTEEIHEEKVKHLQNLHEDEIGVYQREIDVFRMKLEQVDRYQARQVELDEEVKELIRDVEINFTKTVQSITKNHEVELKLKQTEIEAVERRYLEEINHLKEKQEVEVDQLKNKLKELKEPDVKIDSEECKSLKHQVEELTVELLKHEGTIAVKEEIENALNDRVKELEDLIQFKEDNCRKELENLLSKYMKVQTLLSAKEEIAKELEDKLKETQNFLEKSRSETEELDRTCVKLKENIQKVEKEKKELRIHFLAKNPNDQHDPVDHSGSKISIDCQVDIPRVDSLETLQYMMRCGELEKENEDLRNEVDRLKNDVIELDVEKDFALEKVKSKTSVHDEITHKFKNIQEELADLQSQKNVLLATIKSLEEERRNLMEESKNIKEENESMREKLKSNDHDLDLTRELKEQNEKLNSHVKSLTDKINGLNAENEKLTLELEHFQKNNQELKNELEEAWTQRCEVEDQLVEVRKENTLLNLTKNQLENTNRRISSLVSEGTPSVVSWLKIHQTVENIVDEVLALKTSFCGESNAGKNNLAKTKSELKLLTETLNLQLENKTKLCNELLIQKKSLEKELRILEELLMQSETNSLNLKSKYESELRNRNLAIRRLQLELQNKQLNEISRERRIVKMDQKIKMAIDEEQLEKIKLSTEQTYTITKKRLKKHFEEQQKSREAELKDALSHEIKLLKKEIKKLEDEVKMKDDALNRKTDAEKQELEGLRLQYQSEIDHLTKEHKTELEKLRSILERVQETGNSSLIIHKMEEEHAKAMEELRTYYEKKCADLEKQFSEEVYRQQSRKMSICSSVSESDYPTDMDSTDTINQIFEQIENKKKEQIVENYRNLFDEEESPDEKKKKLENFLHELLIGHNKELNYLHVKYNKEISNLEAKHTSEMNRINLELSETRRNIEIEKKIFEINLGKDLRKNLSDAIQMEVREKFDQEKNGKVDGRLGKMKEMKSFENICEEELDRCQNGESSKNFEMEQLANFYRSLYETALRKFEERQEQAIKNQKEVIEDYEKQIQELKEAHRNELQQQICDERVKWEKFRMREKELESELSSIKSTYEDELLELRKCCQDTLQEQVSLAKADAINSLQQQIQDFIEGDDGGDPIPKELLELEERFAGKHRKEIEDLQQKHNGEVMRIRAEYEEKINRRYSTGSMPKRMPLNDMKTDDDKLEIMRERDALKDTVGNLRHVLSEFVRYIGICEDELNNSLAGEIGKAEETMYKSIVMDKNNLNDTDCSIICKRVHIAPDISGILNQMNESSLLNASLQIRFELDKCLKQLKNDANCLLALSNPSKKGSENFNGVLKQLEAEKKSLEEKVCAVEEMQKYLQMEVNQTKEKVLEWERNREVVTEGFGEEIISPQKLATLTELRNKAKSLMVEQCNQPSDITNILEEICKEGDRLQEESRREKFDLQQQVEVADKQLKIFKKFLDEQAAEREQERDEFLNEIQKLTDALKVKERDSSLQERTNQEIGFYVTNNMGIYKEEILVEALETQLKEAQARLTETEETKIAAEKKLKDAVDKVWALREIIQDLEKTVASNSQRELSLERKIKDLEDIIEQQSNDNQIIVTELDSLKSQTQAEMTDYIHTLEKELIDLRRLAEQTTPEAISQMKFSLREIESALVRKTKDLELLHASSANVSCSSPSEDVSIREHVDATRCPTPDEMHCHEQPRGGLLMDEIERIHEKLTRHTRAEEVALKSIRDLEMQLKNNRKTLEEIQTERDALLGKVEVYLKENASLKARLDEQRCNAGVIQRQLSADLESQIKRLEVDIEKLNTLCLQKDKQIRDMSALLEQTKKSLQTRESEVLNRSKEENALITKLKTDLQTSLSEKAELEEKVKRMSEKERDNATIPALVDAMLEEKNAEIDHLKKEVVRLSGQRAVSSLIGSKALTDSAKSKRIKFSEPDSFVEEFISPILNENISSMRSASDSYADLKISTQRFYKPLACFSTPESLSSIGPLQLSPRAIEPYRHNWNHHPKSPSIAEEHATNEDVASLKKQLTEKTKELRKYESQLSERSAVDSEIGKIRDQLQATMKTVEEDKEYYKDQFALMAEAEAKLQNEIDSKRREISEQLVEIDTLRHEVIQANNEFLELKSQYDADIAVKNEEIENLKRKCNELEEVIKQNTEEKKELKNELNFEKNRIEMALNEIRILEGKKDDIEKEFYSLKNDYDKKINEEQKLCSKLKSDTADLHNKNLELAENFSKIKDELESTVKEYEKLSSDFATELSNVKDENKRLKDDYLALQNDLQSYLEKSKKKVETGPHVGVERTDGSSQMYENVEMALVPVKKYDQCDEFNQFQENVQKLRCEITSMEEKMNEDELKKDEALSFLALIRTLLTCIGDNLDDHFYELQTYRKKMMECSVDDLTDRVQRELLLSAKLDNELLSNFQGVKPGELEDAFEKSDNMIIPKQVNFVNVTLKISELEANLQNAMERNNDLQSQVLDVEFEKEELQKRVDKQKNFIKMLEDSLAKEKKKLEMEKTRYEEDAKIMELLRVNFENSSEKRRKLEMELSNERQQRALLEQQVKANDNGQLDSGNLAVSDLRRQLESERQKIISSGINVEKEKRKCQELRASLEREKLERLREKEVQRLMGTDLALLQEQKENLENQLSNAREMLKAREDEVSSLKRKISLMEIDIKALAASNEHQLDKESEQSMMAEKIKSLEQELDFYRSEVYALTEKPEREIPSPLVVKMKSLSSCVQQHVKESNEMGEALLHLTQETEQMKSLIKQLEETTEQNSVKSADDTLLADSDMERKSWMMEKERLISELEAVRNEYESLKLSSIETFKNNDMLKFEIKKLNKEIENLKEDLRNREKSDNGVSETRIVHLFGKYMRAESYRKALAWQKRYLMLVISSYEDSEEDTWLKLNKLAIKRREVKRHNFGKAKRRSLKGVAMVLIAVQRMQYMVKRWRHGRLTGVQALLGRHDATPAKIKGINRPTSTISLTSGPIDPLAYQTHNFVRPRSQPSPIAIRNPRELDLRSRLCSPSRDVMNCKNGF